MCKVFYVLACDVELDRVHDETVRSRCIVFEFHNLLYQVPLYSYFSTESVLSIHENIVSTSVTRHYVHTNREVGFWFLYAYHCFWPSFYILNLKKIIIIKQNSFTLNRQNTFSRHNCSLHVHRWVGKDHNDHFLIPKKCNPAL